MGVDVVDLVGPDARILQGPPDRSGGTSAVVIRLKLVVGVGRGPVAQYLGMNPGVPP